jgi:hypothetical protein
MSSVTTIKTHVRFGFFTAMTMKNAVFWDVAPFRPCVNRRSFEQQQPPKRRLTQDLHCATSQKTAFSNKDS